MRAAADLLAWAVDLPREFHGPVGYSDRWIWLAVLGLALVGLYVAASLWFTRERPPPPPPPAPPRPDVRTRHLARLDAVEAGVRAGDLGARDGHQQLSEIVRSYVEAITPLPASTMTLTDFRQQAPRLADVIELMYPPEFAPGEAEAIELFDRALQQARGVVSTWRR